jgi:hypothetical protein
MLRKKPKADRPFRVKHDPDLKWGQPLYRRPQVPAIVKVKIAESEGMLRGGQENQESFDTKGSGLRNPLSVPEEQKQRFERLSDIPPLRAPLPAEPLSIEENFRRQIAEEKKQQREQDRQLEKLLPVTAEPAPLPDEFLRFHKEIQSDAKFLRGVQKRFEQSQPTAAQLLLSLDENDVFAKSLTEPEWALWKVMFVFRFAASECSQLFAGVHYEDMKPAIPKIHKAGQPWSWCVAERYALVETNGGQDYLNGLFRAAYTLGIRSTDDIAATFTQLHQTLVDRANWFAEFRYPTPTVEELNQKRELQKLALDAPNFLLLSEDEKTIMLAWIVCWWNGREAARRLDGQFSQSTVARTIRKVLTLLEDAQHKRKSKFADAFLARTLADHNSNGNEFHGGPQGVSGAEIMLAINSAPKKGETGWAEALGGASIRSSYHHGQYTFERWGRTFWTNDGKIDEGSNRGQFWDSMDEESGA